MPYRNIPHPEERPTGPRLEGRTAPMQPSAPEGGAARYWQHTLWAMVGIQLVMAMANSML